MKNPKIVILGAGYGGLIATKKLEKVLKSGEAEVTLVNKHDYHYIATQLHKTGVGTASDDKITMQIRDLINNEKTNFVKGTVSNVNFENKQVLLESGETLPYDYLLIALGFEIDTFGVPGVKEHAFGIRSFRSTKAIYNHILKQLASYKVDQDPARLTFAVAGGGFTGIEMIGELAEGLPELCKAYDVPFDQVKIVNIEAAPTILPGFDQKAVEFATDLINKYGIQLMTSTKILECTPESIKIDSGEEIPCRTLIWSGGVKGNSIMERLGFETVRGRVEINKFLQIPSVENVFALGDCTRFMKDEKNALPPTAQVAIQQAQLCGENIAAAVRGEALKPFEYHHKGTVASIGDRAAVGKVGSFSITGAFGAVLKQVIEARYLLVLGGPALVLKQVFKHKPKHPRVAVGKNN